MLEKMLAIKFLPNTFWRGKKKAVFEVIFAENGNIGRLPLEGYCTVINLTFSGFNVFK